MLVYHCCLGFIFVSIVLSAVWPNDAFNPIEIRVNARINARNGLCAADLSKRCDTYDSVHARHARMIILNRSSWVALKWTAKTWNQPHSIRILKSAFIRARGLHSLGTYLCAPNAIRHIVAYREQFRDWAAARCHCSTIYYILRSRRLRAQLSANVCLHLIDVRRVPNRMQWFALYLLPLIAANTPAEYNYWTWLGHRIWSKRYHCTWMEAWSHLVLFVPRRGINVAEHRPSHFHNLNRLIKCALQDRCERKWLKVI